MEPSPSTQPYATAAIVAPLLLGVEALGGDADAALQAAGLRREALNDPEHRLAASAAVAVFEHAVGQLGDDLGLRLARLYEPGAFSVLDYLAQSSDTLATALRRMIRYEGLHQNCLRSTLRIEGDEAIVEQQYVEEGLRSCAVVDSSFANLVTIGRRLVGRRLRPLRVTFAHGPPADTGPYGRVFDCPCQWDAGADTIVLRADDLQLPVRSGNPALAQSLEAHAREVLSRMRARCGVTDEAREHIARMLPDGAPTLAALAKAAGLSRRTLQRRLAAEGVTVKQLVDDVRAQLSLRYLREHDWPVEEVGLMLGFSDGRAFRRAFKRWHGAAPSTYRR